MTFITRSFVMPYLVHDSWSETYIGARRIAYEILPPSGTKLKAEDGALCQMTVVGANHLMEVAIFDLLRPYINAPGGGFSVSPAQFENQGYYFALTDWVEKATGRPIDLAVEPFVSTEILRKRRNDTAHKSSAIATAEMARSALWSGVEGTRALYSHFGKSFKYQAALKKWPLIQEASFSSLQLP